jgi:hypothetical protein
MKSALVCLLAVASTALALPASSLAEYQLLQDVAEVWRHSDAVHWTAADSLRRTFGHYVAFDLPEARVGGFIIANEGMDTVGIRIRPHCVNSTSGPWLRFAMLNESKSLFPVALPEKLHSHSDLVRALAQDPVPEALQEWLQSAPGPSESGFWNFPNAVSDAFPKGVKVRITPTSGTFANLALVPIEDSLEDRIDRFQVKVCVDSVGVREIPQVRYQGTETETLMAPQFPFLPQQPELGVKEFPRRANSTASEYRERILGSTKYLQAVARMNVAKRVCQEACLLAGGTLSQRGRCEGVPPANLLATLHARRTDLFQLEETLSLQVGLEDRRGITRRCTQQQRSSFRPIPAFYDRAAIGSVLELEECSRVGLEVGSYSGAFADVLLSRWASAWALFLVDPWTEQAHYEDILAASVEKMSAVMEMALMTVGLHLPRAVLWREFGNNAAAQLPGEMLDFVYLDARHDYTSVTEDLEAWWPRLRKAGIMGGHDFMNAKERNDGNQWEIQPDGTVREDMLAVRGAVEHFANRVQRDVIVEFADDKYPSFLMRK